MKYLVTGAAGFIASKVCEYLLADGHEVFGIDNLNSYYDVRLKDHRLGLLLKDDRWKSNTNPEASCYSAGGIWQSGNFRFQKVDIEDPAAVQEVFQDVRFDGVFNLAARAGVRYSMENPLVYLTTNAIGTLNLLDGMRASGCAKLVLASTSSLYAGQPMPFTEDLPVNTPISPYAASKKAAEVLAYSYHYLYGIDVSVVRYFTVFGPAGRPDMSIFRFIKWIDEGTPIELFGDGTQSRDFTYVDDIARGTIAAGQPVGYEIINLGGGKNPLSLQTIIAWLEEMLGKPAAYSRKPYHVADIKETWADISKAARLLSWSPSVSVPDGLKETVRWYLQNRPWVRNVVLP